MSQTGLHNLLNSHVLLGNPVVSLVLSAGSNMQLIDVPISNCIRSGINKM